MHATRTAVLVIHGVGSQRPLETLRAAADALYTTDPRFEGGSLWLSMDRDDPDRDLDLPLLTSSNIAPEGAAPHYIDFHECYWAHLMAETRFVAVPLWIFELVRKGPSMMAGRIRGLWPIVAVLFDLWLLAAVFLALSAAGWCTAWRPGPLDGPIAVWSAAVLLAFLCMGRNGALVQAAVLAAALAIHRSSWGAASLPMTLGNPTDMWIALGLVAMFFAFNAFFLLTVVGDAARYYRAAPANIEVRRAARKLAVDRLRALHADKSCTRIVVVAHSLGSTIGYDMLRAYWSEICLELGDPDRSVAFRSQDAMARGPGFDLDAWIDGTAALFAALPDLPNAPNPRPRWIVSDFITLGSPLTSGRFLMADGASAKLLKASFERKRQERELPQDPAWHVSADGALIGRPSGIGRCFLHHAALFGVTRWTNLYFPLRALVFGDVVGGPVREDFGPGIIDQKVPIGKFCAAAAHTHYFDVADPQAAHLVELRRAAALIAS